jgi:hypothetical protein
VGRSGLGGGLARKNFLQTGLATRSGSCHTISRVLSLSRVPDELSGKINHWAQAAAAALPAPALWGRLAARTGGPGDDEDDELRWLMPILASVIAVALVFG